MMDQRNYQPGLLWAKCESWYMEQLDPPPVKPYRAHDLTVYIYRTDSKGAYMLNGPKLCWQAAPMSGDHYNNIEQDDIAKHGDELGEVVIWDCKLRKTTIIGNSFEAAIEKLNGKRKAGRPQIGDHQWPAIMVPDEILQGFEAKSTELDRSIPDLRRQAYFNYLKPK
jgi:hypothetical protein